MRSSRSVLALLALLASAPAVSEQALAPERAQTPSVRPRPEAVSPKARTAVQRVFSMRKTHRDSDPESRALAHVLEEARILAESARASGTPPSDALAAKADAIRARLADFDARAGSRDSEMRGHVRARCQEVLTKIDELRAAPDLPARRNRATALLAALEGVRRLPAWATDTESHPGFTLPDRRIDLPAGADETAP